MIAFVMSGGANLGALEAGALLALFEAGIHPDILVGTSAGSLNAAYIATDPTLEGAHRLADFWAHARQADFFPGGWLNVLWRVVRGRSLFDSAPLRHYLERQMPPDKKRFGDLAGVKLYITAANLTTGTLYLYGNQPDALLIDAVMASTAHPLAYPPVSFRNCQLVDGGVIANVPVGIAVDKGATEIYVLNVGYGGEPVTRYDNMFQTLNQSISLMMYQHFVMDLKYVLENTNVVLHHIPISYTQPLAMWDLQRGTEMVKLGQKAAEEYLKSPLGLASLPMAAFGDMPEEVPPAGAEVYVPAYFSPVDLLGLSPLESQVTAYVARHPSTDTAALAQALGRSQTQVCRALAVLIKKGYVQSLPDGNYRLVFGRSRRRNVPDQVWESLGTKEA